MKLESSDGVTTARIGDADKNVHGVQTYVVSYHLAGVINRFADHDEFYWNAIGPGWDFTVWNGVTQVTGPAAPDRITCFSGPVGATTLCDAASVSDGVAGFQEQTIPPNAALTVAVAYPSGTFTADTSLLPGTLVDRSRLHAQRHHRRWSRRVARVGRRWRGRTRLFGRPRSQGGGLPHAMSRSPHRELRAYASACSTTSAPPSTSRHRTTSDRPSSRSSATRKSATATSPPPSWIWPYAAICASRRSARRSAIPTIASCACAKQDASLLPYENTLLGSLFMGQNDVVLSQFEDTFAAKLEAVKNMVYTDGIDRGWFSQRPDKVVQRWRALGFVVMLLGAGLTAAAIAWTKVALLPIPIFIGGLLIWLFAKRFPSRTAAGTGMRRRAGGFEIFMRDSEGTRARWAEQRNIFSEYLPYAVVLGIATKWAKTFEPLGAEALTGTTTWYIGREPFSADRFGHATENFASAASSTLSSVPQSSSGSSGFSGGSSGGGGGGGGGGSW